MVSTPARIASLMPAAPCACAATLRPAHVRLVGDRLHLLQASAAAAPGSVLRENTPPVAQILITCAPYLRSVAHALAAFVGAVDVERALLRPSTAGRRSNRNARRWRRRRRPRVTMRGPASLPSSIAWRRPTSFQASAPTLRTVVKPASSVRLRVRHRQHRPEAVVELQAGVAAVGRVAVEVHVHVDQAGQQRHVAQVVVRHVARPSCGIAAVRRPSSMRPSRTSTLTSCEHAAACAHRACARPKRRHRRPVQPSRRLPPGTTTVAQRPLRPAQRREAGWNGRQSVGP